MENEKKVWGKVDKNGKWEENMRNRWEKRK